MGGGGGGGSPWFYLPPNYNPDDLPDADDDSPIIPPFNERVNVVAGIALGTRAASQLAQGLIPQTVEIGIALGLDGSNANYKQLVEVGIAAGVAVDSSSAFIKEDELGVALGIEAMPVKASRPTSLVVALGTNVCPPI